MLPECRTEGDVFSLPKFSVVMVSLEEALSMIHDGELKRDRLKHTIDS